MFDSMTHQENLNIAIIQADLAWESPKENKNHFGALIDMHLSRAEADIILLPEMFTTGFSMRAEFLAEEPCGASFEWMQKMAGNTNSAICGSVITRENSKYFNRLYWVLPSGEYKYYDKRHLFSLAGEEKIYSQGITSLETLYKGWKIHFQVCYDLRFPVWSRNLNNYDLLINIANWPDRRSYSWQTLLRARAIENLSYVAACNRIGMDGNEVYHSGYSAVLNPLGEMLLEVARTEGVYVVQLSMDALKDVRQKLGFLADRDSFEIKN